MINRVEADRIDNPPGFDSIGPGCKKGSSALSEPDAIAVIGQIIVHAEVNGWNGWVIALEMAIDAMRRKPARERSK